ncbi:hypothetical protein BDV12DRAFT_161102 [Aspergillus spectabilis]
MPAITVDETLAPRWYNQDKSSTFSWVSSAMTISLPSSSITPSVSPSSWSELPCPQGSCPSSSESVSMGDSPQLPPPNGGRGQIRGNPVSSVGCPDSVGNGNGGAGIDGSGSSPGNGIGQNLFSFGALYVGAARAAPHSVAIKAAIWSFMSKDCDGKFLMKRGSRLSLNENQLEQQD